MNSIAPMSTPRVGWPTSEEIGVAVQLAGEHDLLLVAARERGGGQAPSPGRTSYSRDLAPEARRAPRRG